MQHSSVKERIGYLEYIITHLDTLYISGEDCIHPDTGKIVSDNEYDALRKELEEICPTSSIFKSVTADKKSISKTITLESPMASISKANGTQQEKSEILCKWISDCLYRLKNNGTHEEIIGDKTIMFPIDFFVQSYKRDGVGCAINYKNGILTSACLRPRDGLHGEDITSNIQYIKNIPNKLPLNVSVSVRGELEIKNSVFLLINEELLASGDKVFANPRNAAAGGIRQFKNPERTRKMGMSFIAHSIEWTGSDLAPYKTEIERAKWCSKELGIEHVRVELFKFSDLDRMEKMVGELDYGVDGIVLSVNDLEWAEQLGRYGNNPNGNPKSKLAWKFKDQTAIVKVKKIAWQTGRTGRVTPVLEFDGVQLEGTTVSRCTAHNVGMLIQHNICEGSEIEIRKSGKIIPKFERLIKSPKNKDVTYPDQCSGCGGKLIKTETGKKGEDNWSADLICNNTSCPSQNIENLVHYLSEFGVKGVGESMVANLVENGLVNDPADFYGLSIKQMENIGITRRMALLTIARIHMVDSPEQEEDNKKLAIKTIECMKEKKHISLAQFIACLGISGASKGTGRALSSHFNSFDEIRNADIDGFKEVEDIGETTAISLYDYFKENKSSLDVLIKHIEIEMPKQGKFTGKTFVFTGGFEEGKKKWQNAVEELGGKCGSSVSKKTNFVIVGTDPGSKEKVARDLVKEGCNTLKIVDLEGLKLLLK